MELQTLQSYAQSKGFDGDLEIYDVDYWVRRQRNSILGMLFHSGPENLKKFRQIKTREIK